MRALFVIPAPALALILAACGEPPGGAQTAANGCAAETSSDWAGDLTATASTSGPDCTRAVATIVIRDASGTMLWSEIFPTEHVMVLAGAADPAAMGAALEEWIAPDSRTANSLPAWPQAAESPEAGEFPFYVEEGYDRAAYEAIRAENAPLFCYVQGMESLACLVLRDGALEKIGVQTFPG